MSLYKEMLWYCLWFWLCLRSRVSDGGRATGKKVACDGFALYAHECCGITKAPTDECKWSYCGGFTIAGQTTCNDSFGSGWKYNEMENDYLVAVQFVCCIAQFVLDKRQLSMLGCEDAFFSE
ncbi:hypothetical protein V8B55DRAFT_1590387 [Mucor lusitanicus]